MCVGAYMHENRKFKVKMKRERNLKVQDTFAAVVIVVVIFILHYYIFNFMEAQMQEKCLKLHINYFMSSFL